MLDSSLAFFKPITLSELNGVSLMKRVDTKFILHKKHLVEILTSLQNDFQILEIDQKRLMEYQSLYFDTAEKQFYFQHHNGIANRCKIRMRCYIDSNLTFLEIKQKDPQGNTVKSRIKIPEIKNELFGDEKLFVQGKLKQEIDLIPSISNGFNRFTLISNERKERVTFDLNLTFNNQIFNDNLVIVELKQAIFKRNSPLVLALKNKQLYPYKISKYCLGIALHNPEIKQNLFKHKFLTINKVTH